MDYFEASSVHEYVKIVEGNKPIQFYRGVSKSSYSLLSSLGRLKHIHSNSNILVFERDALYKFKTQVMSYGSYSHISILDLLLLAQHHGLPTRLMDWTTNPLVALFFSVRNLDKSEDGCVYILKSDRKALDNYISDNIIGNNNYDNFCGEKRPFVLCIGNSITPRVNAQSGVFTVHYKPFKVIDESFIDKKIIILKENKINIYSSLEKLGVHEHSLFPSLEGLATWVRRIHFPEP